MAGNVGRPEIENDVLGRVICVHGNLLQTNGCKPTALLLLASLILAMEPCFARTSIAGRSDILRYGVYSDFTEAQPDWGAVRTPERRKKVI
jgi:hypothetical protein